MIREEIKTLLAQGALQLSRKYRTIGVPPKLTNNESYLNLLRRKNPELWRDLESRARDLIVQYDYSTHIKLSHEEFNIWLELRGCAPSTE